MNPWAIDGPTVIQCSFGRTSAFMLWKYIQAHGGIPSDAIVLFENTGKEREETLEFGVELSARWNVEVHWLEWLPPVDADGRLMPRPEPSDETFTKMVPVGPLFGDVRVPALGRRRPPRREYIRRCRTVNFKTASRKGEPFEALVEWAGMLPNPTAKICTQHLKIETSWAFIEGVLGWMDRTVAVGIRADEPKRFGSLGLDDRNDNEFKIGPLAESGITKDDVMEFWSRQPFDLKLAQHEGNCDLCPWKTQAKRKRIMRDRPDLVPWWIAQEERVVPLGRGPSANRFKVNEPTFRQLWREAVSEGNQVPILDEDDSIPCGCAG